MAIITQTVTLDTGKEIVLPTGDNPHDRGASLVWVIGLGSSWRQVDIPKARIVCIEMISVPGDE